MSFAKVTEAARLTEPGLTRAVTALPATQRGAQAAATLGGQRPASPTGPLAIQRLQRLDRSAYVQELRDGILSTVIANFDHLRGHPQQLAWAMMHLEIVTNIGIRSCDATLKYSHDVVEAAAAALSPDDHDLLRDAIHVAHYDHGTFEDLGRLPRGLNAAAAKKTFADIVRIKQDASNPSAGLYKTERDVATAFLATCDTGGWTEDGFLTRAEPGMKGAFAGYTHIEAVVPSAIKDAIVSYRADPMLAEHVVPFVKGIYWAWQGNFVEQAVFDAAPIVAKRAGIAAVEELRYVSYVHELLRQAAAWTPEQWTAARASESWTYGHVAFDVSQVTLDDRTEPRDISQGDAVSRRAGPGESGRHALWNDWVHAFTDEHVPAVVSAKTTVLRSLLGAEVDYDPSHPKAALFDRESGADVTGWDAIARLVERSRRASTLFVEANPRGVTIMDGSPMMAMPENAHASFVTAARELALAALENPADPQSRSNAETFLARLG